MEKQPQTGPDQGVRGISNAFLDRLERLEDRGAAQGAWSGLVERELEAVRGAVTLCRTAADDARARVLELEGGVATLADLEELAEIVLQELRIIRNEILMISGSTMGLPERIAEIPASNLFRSTRQTSRTQAANRLNELEKSADSACRRLDALECQKVANALAARLTDLEKEVGGMANLKKIGPSLRALDGIAGKVQALHQAAADAEACNVVAKAKNSDGASISADSFRMQAMLDQTMQGMEALTRQRNADIRLVNASLAEVYARLNACDGLSGDGVPVKELRAEVTLLASRVDGVQAVHLKEIQDSFAHYRQSTTESVSTLVTEVAAIKENVATVLRRLGSFSAQLETLVADQQRRGLQISAGEAALTRVQADLNRARERVDEFCDPSLKDSVAASVDIRLSFLQAELNSRIDHRLEQVDKLSGACAKGLEAPEILREEIRNLCREIAETKGHLSRSDVELRKRVAESERELRREVRVAQDALLDLAGQVKNIYRRESPTQVWPLSSDVEALQVDTEGFVCPGSLQGEGDLVRVTANTFEWRVKGVKELIQDRDARMLVSKPAEVPRLSALVGPEIGQIQLRFFPLGSRKRAQTSHCSLYVHGPEGVHLQFLLGIGSVQHGPLECYFNRQGKITGRHDFCMLEKEIEPDGSVLARISVLQASLGTIALA